LTFNVIITGDGLLLGKKTPNRPGRFGSGLAGGNIIGE